MKFDAPTHPDTYLRKDFPSYDDKFEFEDASDMLNPIVAVDWLIEEITGWSPVRAISNEFSGDFASLYEARDGWDAYADALGQHANGYWTAVSLQDSWEGESWERFWSYVGAWGLAVQDLADNAEAMAATLGPIADDTKELSNTVGEGLIALGEIATSVSLKGGLKAIKGVWSLLKGELDDMIAEIVELVFDLMNAVDAIVELGQSLPELFNFSWNGPDLTMHEVKLPTGNIWRPDKYQEDL